MCLNIPVTNQRQPTDDPPGAAQDGYGEPERVLAAQARAYREKLGLTQDEIAAAMTARGHRMRQSTVAKIEAAQRPVRVNEAVALAAVLHADLPALLAGPAQQDRQDALAAARDEERELAGQLRQAERRLEEHRQAHAAAEYAVADSAARLEAIQARHAEAREKAEALAAAGGSESD